MSNKPVTPKDVLDFWFVQTKPEQWFKKDDAFDEEIRSRFGATVEQALSGELTEWAQSDDGSLALVIVLDQFARNLFRETPKAFSGDPIFLAISLERQRQGYLLRNEQNERYFMLMPMMHSEDLTIQNASIPLFEKICDCKCPRLRNQASRYYCPFWQISS